MSGSLVSEAIIEPPVDAIDWHEGMLLAPQHFQQLALRQEMLLQYHAGLMAPWHWGVCSLRLDTALLTEGIVRIAGLEAVMPDGLPVFVDGGGPDLRLDLAPFAGDIMREPLRIHLAVPSRRLIGAGGDLGRYLSQEGQPVTDQSSGEGEVVIPRLTPRLALLPGATPPQKYVSFPLLEIGWINEAFGLTDFIAPRLRTPGGCDLGRLCAQVVTRVREKARYLSEQGTGGGGTGNGGGRASEAGRVVAGLVTGLPGLEALLASEHAHPFALYVALAQLAGGVATAGSVVVPPAVAPYQHNDLLACFTPLANFILNRLESFQLAYRELPFTLTQGAFHLETDAPERYGRRLVIGVRRNIRQTEAEAAAWLEQAIIGGGRRIASLNARRVLGLRRTRIAADEELSVEASARTQLFALENDPDVLDPKDTLTLHNPGHVLPERMPAEVVLFVRNTRQLSPPGSV